MARIYFILFFLLFLNTANAQQPVFQWAVQFGSSQLDDTWNDNGRSVAVDAQGNVYSIGLFFSTLDFDPGPGVYNMTAQGWWDHAIYISKLSPSGKFIWAKMLPVLIEGPMCIALDKNANVYVTSELRQPTDMDPGPGIHTATPIGTKDAFVLKLNTNGDFVWVKQFGGTGGDTVPFASVVTVDKDGNIIVCGGFNHVVDFDPGPGTFNMSAVGTSESFITKLSSEGELIWAKELGNCTRVYDQMYINDVKCDNDGNIYTTGTFTGNCDFDPGNGSFRFVSGGPGDGFISKIDRDGDFVWAKHIGNSAGNYIVQPWGIDVDSKGDVYTTGYFLGTQDFDPGNNVHNITSNGSFDGFILKLNAQGDFAWVKNIGGSDGDISWDITVDNNDNVYTIGQYGGKVDFNPGGGVFLIDQYYGTVVSKLDMNGNFIYAFPFDGYITGVKLVTDAAENIYVTGSFGGSSDFDPGLEAYTLTEGRGWIDAFVLKLSKCKNITTNKINISTCDSYTLNDQTYDTSGIYMQTIPNSTGCDSIITLNLTINKKFTAQIKEICEGESLYVGGASQTASGTYKDSLRTSSGCDSIVATYLLVNPKPTPVLGPDKDLCMNTQLTITPGVFTSYAWQNMSTQSSFTVDTAGLFWVTVTNNYNCSATDSIRINAIIKPPSNFLKTTDSICPNDKLVLQTLNNFNDYKWSTGATQGNITVEAPGRYWLTVTDAKGCYGTDTITVLPKECLYGVFIPNAFTPNGDGKNDFFKPVIHGNLQSFKLQIFNSAGQVIFQTTDAGRGWNGMHKGMAYSTSVFVWQCFYQLENGKPGYQKGTLTLIH